jgi:hypothetical protein
MSRWSCYAIPHRWHGCVAHTRGGSSGLDARDQPRNQAAFKGAAKRAMPLCTGHVWQYTGRSAGRSRTKVPLIGSLNMQFIQAHLPADGISMDGFGDAGFSHIGELELSIPGRGTHCSTYPHSRFSVSSQLLHRANSSGRYMLLMKANTMLDMPFDLFIRCFSEWSGDERD